MEQTPSTAETAVLLVNLGTPDAPTASAVRRYLGEFLSDPRVIEIPKPLWWPILHGVILRVRPSKSAKAYATIWGERGSPLLSLTTDLGEAVKGQLEAAGLQGLRLEIAMRYGNPSITAQLEKLKAEGVKRIVVLPLYPQYAAATSASIFDAVAETFRRWRHLPHLDFISDYHLDGGYLDAVAASIAEFWQSGGGRAPLLLFSFHGLPERCRELGDPYYHQCLASAKEIAARLELKESDWRVVFQSRFGPAKWIQPYCVDTLRALPGEGIKSVDLVCPGFAVDCLETLEEIAIANREVFLEAGGERYRYIPALNSRADHAGALAALLRRRLGV